MNNDREIHEEIKADEINTTFPHKRCYKKWPNLVPRTSPLAFGHGGEDKKLKKKNEEEVLGTRLWPYREQNVSISTFK